LPVGLVSLTGHYAAINLAGPAARAVLREHTELDLADNAFPYLSIREAQVAGARCRILRVGFVGELGYEIHVPFAHAVDVWRALLVSGAHFQMQPFGVEAQRILRLEKGHIIVGQDTDGITNALEIGMPWAIKMDKPFFIGQRSLRVLDKQPRRQTLVSFTLPPSAPARPKECHLVLDGNQIAGRVTSVGWSPTLGRCIGLGLVATHVAARKHLRVRVDGGEEVEVEMTQAPFYDPKGERQRAESVLFDGQKSPAALLTNGDRKARLSVPLSDGRKQGATPSSVVTRSPLEPWFRKSAPAPVHMECVLRLEDLSARRRFGCKGPGAEGWLAAAGYRVPRTPNSAMIDADGVFVSRLGTSEFLIEALDGGTERIESTLRQLGAAALPADVYPVARQDLVIGIEGAATNALLRQTCSFDFAPQLERCERDAGPIVLTSLIGVSVVAWLRHSVRGPALTLWVDPSFAHYFWTTLLEVGGDLGGINISPGVTSDTGSG
jgi:sarcosine oxidase, subunit alpha